MTQCDQLIYVYNSKKMSEKPPEKPRESAPGDGIRSMRSTTAFRALNFELYAKPNVVIMGIGIIAFVGVFGYITYMRATYEGKGYYAAVREDGTEQFIKKRSKWD